MKTSRILLVEDSEDDAFFFQHALKKCGFPCQLIVAADGEAAINFFSDSTVEPFDFIFLDLKLPLVGGFDVLRWVGENTPHLLVKIVVLSGSPIEGDLQLAQELGAANYFIKPISSDLIKSCLLSKPEASPAF